MIPSRRLVALLPLLQACTADAPPDRPEPVDRTAPSVSSTVPASLAVGVAPSTVIVATFSEPMDEATIDATTFVVSNGVAGVVTYDPASRTATLTPSSPLSYATTFEASITTGAKDRSGNGLAAAHHWSFTTAANPDTTPPLVTGTVPASGATNVAFNVAVTATFDEPMAPATITSASFTVSGVTGSVEYDASSRTATFRPTTMLEPVTAYTATLNTTATDLAGNSLAAPHIWMFNTGAAPDTAPPLVTSTSPSADTVGVAPDAMLSITFSEAIDIATLGSDTVVISPAVAGELIYDSGSYTVSFTPDAPLAHSTTYSVRVTTGVKDLAGNALLSAHVFGFTTGAVPRYAFVASYAEDTVASYAVDGASGRLTFVAKAAAGVSPRAIAVHPTGAFVYVADEYGNDVLQYAVGADGVLTAMATPAVAAGNFPVAITLDAAGSHAYVVSRESGEVAQFTVEAGALVPMTPATVPAGSFPVAIAVGSARGVAYVASAASDSISQYTLGTDGSLTPMTPATAASSGAPMAIAIDPTESYVYVASLAANSVTQYVLGGDGTLAPMTPATISAGGNPIALVIDPTGRYLYAANQDSGDVSQFGIGADGKLAQLTPATLPAGARPRELTIDPTGSYLYVTNALDGAGGNSVAQYRIGGDGRLTPMSPRTVAAHTEPVAIAVSKGSAAPVLAPTFAYAASTLDDSVSQYLVGSTGRLAPLTAATVATGDAPWALAVHPSGRVAYVTSSNDHTLSQYSIGDDGQLTAMAPATIGAGNTPVSVAVDPSGRYVYAVANSGGGGINQYTVGSNGALTAMSPWMVDAGISPRHIAIHPSGRYAYVINEFGPDISQYSIGPSGALSPMSPASVATQPGPMETAIGPSGEYAYVACRAGGILQFVVGDDGGLTPHATPWLWNDLSATSITIERTGRYAYAANRDQSSISQFVINADGTLAALEPPQLMTEWRPQTIVADPGGSFVYVTHDFDDEREDQVLQYVIGADGTLTPMATPAIGAGGMPKGLAVVGRWQ